MKYAIAVLIAERNRIIENLKKLNQERQENINSLKDRKFSTIVERDTFIKKVNDNKEKFIENAKRLQDTDKAINWLELLNQTGVEKANRFEVTKLPFQENCFANYRVMIDNEAESVRDYKDANIVLYPDDIILKRK